MSDDWDELFEQPVEDDASNDASASVEGGQGRARGRPQGKLGAKKKTKGAENKSSTCFVHGCDARKKGNSDMCADHHKVKESIRYQAERDTEMKSFNEIFSDPFKAEMAINKFRKENFIDGKFRKKLIDWASWKRTFGVRVSYTTRTPEELWDFTDYKDHHSRRGKTDTWVISAWQALVDDRKVEREGEGTDVKLWLPTKKTRFKEVTQYIDTVEEEGGKQLKDPTADQLGALRNYAKNSAPGFEHAFLWEGAAAMLSGNDSGSSSSASAADSEESKKLKTAEVAFMAPAAMEKYEKEYALLHKQVDEARESCQKQLEECKQRSADGGDKQFASYLMTAEFRFKLLQVAMAATPSEAKAFLSPDEAAVIAASRVGGGSPAKVAQAASPLIEMTPDNAAAAGAGSAENGPPNESEAAKEGIVEGAKAEGIVENDIKVTPSKKSSAPSIAGESGTSGSKFKKMTNGAQITEILQQAYKDCGIHAPVCDIEKVLSFPHFQELVESLLGSESVDVLTQKTTRLGGGMAALRALRAGATKAASTLIAHLRTKQKAAENKRKRDTEAAAVDEAKKKARQAAEAIKLEEAKVPAVFEQKFADLIKDGTLTNVVSIKGVGTATVDNLEQPALITECEAMTSFCSEKRVQLMMGQWGGQYKKRPSTKSHGRVQEPTKAAKGREEADAFMQRVMSMFPEDSVVALENMPAGFKNLLSVTWLYGYDTRMHSIGCTPNGMGMIKALCAGEVTWLMWDVAALAAALKEIDKATEPISIDTLTKRVQTFTKSDFADIRTHGCITRVAIQKMNTIMVIPAGYMVAQLSSAGVLLYGVRRTFLQQSDAAAARYEELIGCFEAANKDTVKMRETVELMKATT